MKAKLLFLLLAISQLAFSQIPTADLHSTYEFINASLVNTTGNGDFTQTGTALTQASDRFSVANYAVSLDGDHLTRSDINFPDDANGFGNEATISFWVKSTTNDANFRTIFEDTNSRSSQSDTAWAGYYIYLKDGKIGFNFRVRYSNGNIGYRTGGLLSTTVVSDGEWHNVIFTIYNEHSSVHSGGSNNVFNNTASTTALLYIDEYYMGYAGASHTISTNGPAILTLAESHDTPGNITIANNRTNNLPNVNRYYDIIDDIHIYTRNLTASERAQLASDGNYCLRAPNTNVINTTAITNTTATVNLVETGTYDIAYHKTDDPFSSAIINTNITSGTLNLSGLDIFKDYNVYVRKHCSNTLTDWSIPLTFTTTRTIGKIYVNNNAVGNNNGISWANAYTNLETALANMADNEDLWIAQGTYTPHASNRIAAFTIANEGAKIYGGFNGTESLLSHRDIIANPTILSGDLLGNDDVNVTFNNATRAENSYHVTYITAANVLIDGVTITSGYADTTASNLNRVGAGILKAGAATNFTLKNVIIKDNVAYWGAGLIVDLPTGNSNITLDSCTFDNNLCSGTGAAFYIRPLANTTLNFVEVNCLIKNNKTANNGSRIGFGSSAGHLRAYETGSVIHTTIVNNTIVNNSNEGTGSSDFATVGLSNFNGSFGTVTLANNIFWDNTNNGGGVAYAFGHVSDASSPTTSATSYNSIDQEQFSNFANQVATSNSNPLFVDVANQDYTLQSGSPAIDSGINSSIPSGIVSDFLGNSRIYNTTVDMGIYEFGATLGITQQQLLNAFTVFPNPTQNYLYIKSATPINKIEVFTVLGQKVIETTKQSIETRHLSNGIYLLKVYTANGNMGVKRFIKK
jgi:hypothetical protein